jgi:hypothetical protein
VNSLEEMTENTRWLAKADFLAPTVHFGAVSKSYRKKYLKNLRNEQALLYFEQCIPDIEYWLSAADSGFTVCSNDWLFRETESSNHTDTLIPLGLLPVAVDGSGSPLLLDVESGKLCHFLAGYVEGQFLSVYSPQSGFGSIPLTKENVFKKSEAHFEGFSGFFEHAREETIRMRISEIWEFIKREDVEYIDHLMSLGLDLNIVNEEGRNPAEEAEYQGKARLARMLRAYLDKTVK